MATLFASVLCVLSLFQLTAGNGCQSTNDPCKAKCGGKNVDLSHMLKYPFTIANIADEQGNKYNYSINPCKGVDCNSDNPAAVCEISIHNKQFNLGSINSFNWSLVSTKPFTVALRFGNGITHGDGIFRQSQITIKESNDVNSTQLTYDHEEMTTNTYYFTLKVRTLKSLSP